MTIRFHTLAQSALDTWRESEIRARARRAVSVNIRDVNTMTPLLDSVERALTECAEAARKEEREAC